MATAHTSRRLYHRSLNELVSLLKAIPSFTAPKAPAPPRGAAPVSKAERLLSRCKSELQSIAKEGHTARLEHCIQLMQLAASYLDDLAPADRGRLFRDISVALREANGLGTNQPDAPVQSTMPLAFVVSYPRSGNTLIIQSLAGVLQAQIFEGMPDGMVPFSKAAYPKTYPFPRLIKDHVARPCYFNDRTLLIIRDGRDTMVSLAYMSHKVGQHGFVGKGELADFIRWLDRDYPYGGWAQHMRQVAHLLTGPDKKLVKYGEFLSDGGLAVFEDIVRFVDPGLRVSIDDIRAAYTGRGAIFENLRKNAVANASWGIGAEFEPDSLFYEWSQNRQGSSWRQSWDKAAKKAFHDTGATEFLIEYGYETDPQWWRHH